MASEIELSISTISAVVTETESLTSESEKKRLSPIYEHTRTTTAGGRIGLLRVGGQELAPFVRTAEGRAALALPGSDVEFVLNAIRPEQLL
jgi:hypothetical protein